MVFRWGERSRGTSPIKKQPYLFPDYDPRTNPSLPVIWFPAPSPLPFSNKWCCVRISSSFKKALQKCSQQQVGRLATAAGQGQSLESQAAGRAEDGSLSRGRGASVLGWPSGMQAPRQSGVRAGSGRSSWRWRSGSQPCSLLPGRNGEPGIRRSGWKRDSSRNGKWLSLYSVLKFQHPNTNGRDLSQSSISI